jgi:hypothetical protein
MNCVQCFFAALGGKPKKAQKQTKCERVKHLLFNRMDEMDHKHCHCSDGGDSDDELSDSGSESDRSSPPPRRRQAYDWRSMPDLAPTAEEIADAKAHDEVEGRPATNKRRHKMTLDACEYDSSDGPCCRNGCFGHYSAEEVLRLRRLVDHQTVTSRRTFLCRCSVEHPPASVADGYTNRNHTYQLPENIDESFRLDKTVPQRAVCMNYLQHATGVTSKTILSARKNPSLRIRPANKLVSIITWFTMFATFYCSSPNSDEVFLPFADRRTVYKFYADDVEDPDERDYYKVTPGYFMQMWRATPELRKIKCHKWMRFSVCDTCEDIREQKANLSKNSMEMRALRKKERMHRQYVRKCRTKYYIRQKLARDQPDDYLSIIIDAADQSAYGFPYWRRQSHSQQALTKLKSHLIGAIVHGRETYCYTFLDNINHGTNLTVECLHAVLNDLAEKSGGTLPKKLFLQLDNTCKQNKSK